MVLHTIESGYFKLDGGAMFGVVPKSLWSKKYPADENNMCTWALRCLLIEDGDRLVLIDNGIGDKQSERFFSHYYLHGEYTLLNSIKKAGFSADDITDVFLTHLHFDHCGGGVRWADRNMEKAELTFKNATYWSNAKHWEWATKPNRREKASFLKENLLPIEESGHLKHVKEDGSNFDLFDILFVDGHTEKQMIPHIKFKGKTIVFAADLLPSTAHIPLPYVMSYDTRPLLTLNEKETFFKAAVENDYIIFFEHDAHSMCCSLKNSEKGVVLDTTFTLDEI